MKKKVFLSAAMLGISILALGSVSLAAEQAEKLPAGVLLRRVRILQPGTRLPSVIMMKMQRMYR